MIAFFEGLRSSYYATYFSVIHNLQILLDPYVRNLTMHKSYVCIRAKIHILCKFCMYVYISMYWNYNFMS